MTTPNVDIQMIMPATTLFTATGTGNQRMKTGSLDYVYLPKGASMVQIVATGLKGTSVRIDLTRPSKTVSLGTVPITEATQRIFTDTFANANETASGMWLRFVCIGMDATHSETGTVGVTITPLQFE